MMAGIQPADKSFRYEEIALARECIHASCVNRIDRRLDRLSSISDNECRSNGEGGGNSTPSFRWMADANGLDGCKLTWTNDNRVKFIYKI